jgi:excisionase family DNA binding protein
MSGTMSVNPAHLSDDDWARMRAFLDSARQRGEVVRLSSEVELLSPAEVGRRLSMSRTTVRRRIASGELKAIKVGTHNRVTLAEYERFSTEMMRRMAEATADDIAAELFGD